MAWVNRGFWAMALVALLVACTTSPLGRKQLTLFPDEQLAAMSVPAFQQIQEQVPEAQDGEVVDYVRCVADAITTRMSDDTEWKVTVFEDEAVNAFALPGGQIGVNTGLLRAAQTQDQLAAVIGHEVAHVVARHGNERVSQNFAAEQGLALAAVLSADRSPQTRQLLLAALGVGAQVGVLLPFSRTQEREADVLGLDLVAEAGFDPRASVELWRNMARETGDQPPQFLSTHPAHDERIKVLDERAQKVLGDYQAAREAGRKPACTPPG